MCSLLQLKFEKLIRTLPSGPGQIIDIVLVWFLAGTSVDAIILACLFYPNLLTCHSSFPVPQLSGLVAFSQPQVAAAVVSGAQQGRILEYALPEPEGSYGLKGR